ncbi:unnamed protein product, partial [Prunus brigantina]
MSARSCATESFACATGFRVCATTLCFVAQKPDFLRDENGCCHVICGYRIRFRLWRFRCHLGTFFGWYV